MTDEMIESNSNIGFGKLSYYFWPLALQAISQSFSHPLVAIVASNDEGGALNVAGLAASMSVFSIMGMLGAGIITTGMVYAKDKQGFQTFTHLNKLLCYTACTAQALLGIPIIFHFVFGTLLHLEPEVQKAAYPVTLVSIVLHFLFFTRNGYMVILYNNKETLKASIPSITRVVLTALLSFIFIYFRLVGTFWATICLAIPVGLEVIVYYYFAKPYIPQLKTTEQIPSTKKEMLFFTLPISISSFMVMFSSFIMAAFITRSENGNNMYTVYVLALGLTNPMNFAAGKIHTLILLFYEEAKGTYVLPLYTLFVGIILGAIPLLFTLPTLNHWYYAEVQNLPIELLPLSRETAYLLFLIPVVVAFRAYSEGLVAVYKRTSIYMAGQGFFLAAMAVIGFFSLNLGLSGNLIGGLGLFFANIFSASIMRLVIYTDHLHKAKEGTIKPTISHTDHL